MLSNLRRCLGILEIMGIMDKLPRRPKHLVHAAATIRKWPKWKREIISNKPKPKPIKLPVRNIYWRDITPHCNCFVEAVGNAFVVRFRGRGRRPALVCWHGEEAISAIRFLEDRVNWRKV